MTITPETRPDEFRNQFAPEVTVADLVPVERTFTFTTDQTGAEHVALSAVSQPEIAAHVTGWKPSPDLSWCEYVSANLHYRQPIATEYVRPVSPGLTITVRTRIGRSWIVEYIEPNHLDAAIDAAAARLTGLLALRKRV